MPTTVPESPSPDSLARYRVAQAVSASSGQRTADEIAFNAARCVRPVFSGHFPEQSTGTNDVQIAYSRSPGCKVLLVEVELAATTTAGSDCTVSLLLSGATLVPGSQLDGTALLRAPPEGRRDQTRYVAYLDVTGVTVATIQDLRVRCVSSTGSPLGFWRIHVIEVPTADIDPAGAPTTEVGVNAAWPNPPNVLEAGSASGSLGFVRATAEIDKARSQVKRHCQLCCVELAGRAWTTTSLAWAALTWTGMRTTAYDPDWFVRAKRLYTTTEPNSVTFRARGWVDGAGQSGSVRILLGGVASGTLTFNTTTPTAASVAVNVPTNTASQIVKVEFEALVASAGNQLYLSQLVTIDADG